MSIKERRICRLCLKVAKNEFEVDENMKQMLEILSLKVNLGITKHPIICQDCMEVAKKCLNFKSTCIHTEQIILSSYFADRKEVEHNIKVIYKLREYIRTVPDENFKICRFCMTQFESNNFVSLDTLRNESIFDILSQFMTEMDFNAIENPLICTNCEENIEGYFKFVLNCLKSEEKLKAYCKGKGTYDNVLQFMFTDILEYSDKCSQTCEIDQGYSECVYPETFTYIELIKEELDIEDEQKTLDPKSSVSVDRGVSEIKMFKCSLCPYEATLRRSLNSHMLEHKDVSDVKRFKCPFCPYQTKKRNHLKSHILIHKNVSEIKMFKCSLCAYESRHKSNLRSHMVVHKDVSEIKMHKCPLCAYETKYSYNVKNHMIVHENASKKWFTKYKIA